MNARALSRCLPPTSLTRARIAAATGFLLTVATVASAQVSPQAGHTTVGAGAGLDGAVSPTGGFAASVPLELPSPRGSVPIPLAVVYTGSNRAGVAGQGWDIPISYVRRSTSTWLRKPFANQTTSWTEAPFGAERVTVSLGGRTHLMTKVGDVWWPARGDSFMELRESESEWSLKTLDNHEYIFRPLQGQTKVGDSGRWPLVEIRDSIGGDRVELRYDVPAVEDCDAGLALSSLAYTFDASGENPLYEIHLDYSPAWRPALSTSESHFNRVCATRGTEVALPFEHVRDDDTKFDRGQVLRSIAVNARNNLEPKLDAKTIRRYVFDYDREPASDRPRLISVTKNGEDDAGGAALPVANYHYGTLAHDAGPVRSIRFDVARVVSRSTLPAAMRGDLSTNDVTVSENDGWRTETTRARHLLRDFTGDGLPDLVYKDGAQWVLKENRLTADGPSFSGATMTWHWPQEVFEQTTRRRTGNTWTDRAEMITTETWTQFIDWDGDGRLDILDVKGGVDVEHWAVWMNRRDANGAIRWVPAQIDISPLQSHLRRPPRTNLPFVRDGERVALDRARTWPRYALKTCKVQTCDASGCQPEVDCPSNDPGFPPEPTNYLHTSTVDTMYDWMVTDLNGDGYPDFVAGDLPIVQYEDGYWNGTPQVELNPICRESERDLAGAYVRTCRLLHRQWIDARRWEGVQDQIEENLRQVATSKRIEWLNRHGAFMGIGGDQSSPFPRHGYHRDDAPYGVAYWTTSTEPTFWPEDKPVADAGYNWQAIGFSDPNGDGTPTWRSARRFDPTSGLPAFSNDQASACEAGSGTYSTYQANGELDLNGDGLLDMLSPGGIRFNRGGTYGPRLEIETPGNVPFRVSETVGDCGGSSRAIAGLTDLDADGRPDLLRIEHGELLMSSLIGGGNTDVLESERLIAVDNGYGARTYVKYRNAKRDEPSTHQVPFPEIVVGESGALVLDGSSVSLAPTYFAYGRAEMIYDPLAVAWVFPGYRRQVALRGTAFRDAVEGMVTITDLDPALPAGVPYVEQVAANRVRAVTSFEVTARSPASFLTWTGFPANAQRTFQNRGYELANQQGTNPIVLPHALECGDLDPESGELIGTTMCWMAGGHYVETSESWAGDLPPPWGDNALAGSVVEELDRFGRPTRISGKGDLRRTDDDVCTSITYAKPAGLTETAFPSVVSTVVLTDCGWGEADGDRPGTPQILSAVHFRYDDLPLGQVERGLLTSRDVDRYGPGGFIDSYEVEELSYNDLGRVETTSSTRSAGASTTQYAKFAYDAFGATVTAVTTGASDVGTSIETTSSTSTWPSHMSVSTDLHGVKSIVEYDGHGRVKREAVQTSSEANTRALYEYDDGMPRRVIVDTFPVTAEIGDEHQAAVRRRSLTVFDALGRARYTQSELGADYGDTTLVSGFTVFDELGRARYQADPFEAPLGFAPTPAMELPYGTTRRFDRRGRVIREVSAEGLDETSYETSVAEDIYVRSFEYDYLVGQAQVSTRGPDENDPASPRYGARDESWSTAIGRDLRRQRFSAGGVRVDRVDQAWDRLGRVTETRRYLVPSAGLGPVTWRSEFDSLGRRLSLSEPGVATKHFEYDEQGNELASWWMDGSMQRLVANEYDGFGRLTKRALTRVYGNGSSEIEAVDRFTWDAVVDGSYQWPAQLAGRLSAVETEGVGSIFYAYDAYGRTNSTTYLYKEHGEPVREIVHLAPGGQLLGFDVETPQGRHEILYLDDSAGRTRQVEVNGETVLDARSVSPKGQYLWVKYGNGVVEEFDYATDGREELRSWSAETNSGKYKSANLSYDGAGRVTLETHETPTTGFSRRYTFDDLGQVTRSEQAGGIGAGTEEYTHDPLGNVLTRTATTGTPSKVFTFDPIDPDRLCRADEPGNGGGDCHFSYDGAGNIVHDRSAPGYFTERSFKYDSANRIVGAWRNGAEVVFTYGPAGRARTRVGYTDNARTVWHFGGAVEEIRPDATGVTLTQVRVPGPLGIAVSLRTDSDGNRDHVYSHGDGRGSRFFTNRTGDVIQDVTYSLFGRVVEDTGTPSSLSYTDDLWNGGDHFPEVGITILGARAYDFEHGRFLERDPIMNTARSVTAHPYSFAFNDPANLTDPTGMQPSSPPWETPHPLAPVMPVNPPDCIPCLPGPGGGGGGVDLPGAKGVSPSAMSMGLQAGNVRLAPSVNQRATRTNAARVARHVRMNLGPEGVANRARALAGVADRSLRASLETFGNCYGNVFCAVGTTLYEGGAALASADLDAASLRPDNLYAAACPDDDCSQAGAEFAFGLMTGGGGAARRAGEVLLDTNAVIAAIERGEVAAVLHGRAPVIPITAVKEYLRGGGSADGLRTFLRSSGGRVALAGREEVAAQLRTQAGLAGRSLGSADSRIAASALREGLPVVTRDKQFRNLLGWLGIQMESF